MKDRIHSFGYAFKGLSFFFSSQHNARIHLLAALSAVGLGFLLKITTADWCWIVSAIILVFAMEILNTSIEVLCDHLHPEIHPKIKQVKDLAAAAVLITALGAVIVGCLVFIPKLNYLW